MELRQISSHGQFWLKSLWTKGKMHHYNDQIAPKWWEFFSAASIKLSISLHFTLKMCIWNFPIYLFFTFYDASFANYLTFYRRKNVAVVRMDGLLGRNKKTQNNLQLIGEMNKSFELVLELMYFISSLSRSEKSKRSRIVHAHFLR